MTAAVYLKNISLVLHQPRFPENIGAAARAGCNMGIERLVVVDPREWDLERVRRLATHAAGHVVDDIGLYSDLRTALAGFRYVVGTTARKGAQRRSLISSRRLAGVLSPISQENEVAIVFGPEDRGLTNEDLRLCHQMVNIPTARFSSLNLAQAVMIVCYELFASGLPPPADVFPRLASRHELDGMYDQLRDILVRINYINRENPDYWLNRLRRFGTRMQLRAREVSIIRGICRQVDWYGRKCHEDGRNAPVHHNPRSPGSDASRA